MYVSNISCSKKHIHIYIYIYVLFIFNYVLKYQIYSCIYILGVDGLNSNDNHQQKGWDMIGYKWVYIYMYILINDGC